MNEFEHREFPVQVLPESNDGELNSGLDSRYVANHADEEELTSVVVPAQLGASSSQDVLPAEASKDENSKKKSTGKKRRKS